MRSRPAARGRGKSGRRAERRARARSSLGLPFRRRQTLRAEIGTEACVRWRSYRLTAAPPAGGPCLRHGPRTGRVSPSSLTSRSATVRPIGSRALAVLLEQPGTGPRFSTSRRQRTQGLCASPATGRGGVSHGAGPRLRNDAGWSRKSSQISRLASTTCLFGSGLLALSRRHPGEGRDPAAPERQRRR